MLASLQAAVQLHSYDRGTDVWYRQRDGTYIEAQVLSVDRAVQPPSYAVQVGSSVRETEAERLRLRCAGQLPPAHEPPACTAAGAATWRAASPLPNGASADAWEPVALPAPPLQLWGPSGLGALSHTTNGYAAEPSSPSSDSFGDFADGPPAAEASTNFGSFRAAGSAAGSAAGTSPRAQAPPLGAAERSPFEEALAFACAAPVHEAPAAWPGEPPGDWCAAAAERSAQAAAPQRAAPALAQEAAQPPEEPEEWAWAGEAEATLAAGSQSLPACLDRSAPLPLGLFGEDEGAELGDAPLPALDGLPAWSSAPWPTQLPEAQLPAGTPAGSEAPEERLSPPVQEASVGASAPAAGDSSADDGAREERPALGAIVTCAPAATASLASEALGASANGRADEGSWPNTPAWAAAGSPDEHAVPTYAPSQLLVSGMDAANDCEGTASPAWHAADHSDGYAAWEGTAWGGAAGNCSLQHADGAPAEAAAGLELLQPSSKGGLLFASAADGAHRASCRADQPPETPGSLLQQDCASAGSGLMPSRSSDSLEANGQASDLGACSASAGCDPGEAQMGTAEKEQERPGEQYWAAWVQLLQVCEAELAAGEGKLAAAAASGSADALQRSAAGQAYLAALRRIYLVAMLLHAAAERAPGGGPAQRAAVQAAWQACQAAWLGACAPGAACLADAAQCVPDAKAEAPLVRGEGALKCAEPAPRELRWAPGLCSLSLLPLAPLGGLPTVACGAAGRPCLAVCAQLWLHRVSAAWPDLP